MKQSEYLYKLVARASRLGERLRGDLPPVDCPDALVQQRLAYWQQAVAEGDADAFQDRLALDGWTLDDAFRALCPVEWPADKPLPTWVATFTDALDRLTTGVTSGRTYDEAWPFDALLMPFLDVACQGLETQAGSLLTLISEDAYQALQADLLQTLCGLAAPCFFEAFSKIKPDSTDTGSLYYSVFVAAMVQGEIYNFYYQYSALARLLATITDDWIARNRDLLQHLSADRADLQRLFGRCGYVVSLQVNLSDPHRGRRRVCQVDFESGLRLIYKPKPLGMAALYNDLLAWINDLGWAEPFRCLRVLDRGTYGWMEWVESSACDDESQVQAYFRRMGGLICIVYVLNGDDFHRGNVLACGDQPILIDLEMLCQPLYHQMKRSILDTDREYSVLTSGLLSAWLRTPQGEISDIAGIGLPNETVFERAEWQHINTDQMEQVLVEEVHQRREHVVMLDNEAQSPLVYYDELVAGFEHLYQLLLTNRENFGEMWLPRLGQQRVRLILRNTALYHIAKNKRGRLPNTLQTGVERSLLFEGLYRGYLQGQTKHPLVEGVAAEIAALERDDVPYVTAEVAATTVQIEQIPVSDGVQLSGLQRLRDRLANLSEADCQKQVRFIRWAVMARFGQHGAVPEVLDSSPNLDEVRMLQADQFIERARQLGDRLSAEAMPGGYGVRWLQPTFMPDTEQFRFDLTSTNIYDGSLGIALFLAALASTTGDADYAELAKAAIQPLLTLLQDPDQRDLALSRIGIGGLTGVGSYVYGLTLMSIFLADEDLMEYAHVAAELITLRAIARDHQFDVLGGAAGALLALLTLYRRQPSEDVLARAVACGQHLLDNRSLKQAWLTLAQTELAGLLHGAAGIAYSLLRLYEITTDTDYRDAARQAINYENTLYAVDANNWYDLRREKPALQTCAICHGAAGIGAARLAGLAVLDNQSVRSDISHALAQTAESQHLSHFDHVCCGSMGRIDTLLLGSQILGDQELHAKAAHYASWIIGRADAKTQFSLKLALPTTMVDWGFFQGLSGIGYQLLRLARPNVLPSVTILEWPQGRDLALD